MAGFFVRTVRAHKQTSAVCRHTLFIMVVAALCYAIGGPFAIRLLYGKAYVGAIRALLLMLPGIVIISLYLLLTRNFTSRNRQQVNIVAAVAALGINVGLNCVLIPRWGISGAAISTAVSYSVAALILLVMFVRESGYSVAQIVLVGRSDLEGYVRRARGLVAGAALE